MDPHGPIARNLRIALALTALAGALAFGTLLAITFLVPDGVERGAQAFVRHEVTAALRAKIGERRVDAYQTALQRLRRQLADESSTLRQLRDAPLEGRVQAAIDRLCRGGCPVRVQVAETGGERARHYDALLRSNDLALDRVTGWIQGRYLETVRELTQEVRIFLACNAALFLAVALLGSLRRVPMRGLLIPAGALFVGTTVSALLYLLGQDWLYTLIHNSYVGWTYGAWCAGMALVCVDLAVARGTFTMAVLGVIAEGFATVMGALAACCP